MKSILFLLAFFGPVTSVYAADPACKASVSIADPIFGGAYVPKGDGVTDDTQAIQNVLDYNVCTKNSAGVISCTKPCSPPTTIFFPDPLKAYLISSISIHANQNLVGTGRSMASVSAAGAIPRVTLFANLKSPKAAIVADNLVVNFSISKLSVGSVGSPALSITNRSSNFNITDSSLVANGLATGGTTAIVIVDSYRGNIERCFIAQVGAGWAMSIMNNTNGLAVVNNIIGGSSAGNGVDIGQSQSVAIENNKFIENMPGYGIRVAANVPGGGVSTGLNVKGNYFEQVAKPISLGEANQVAGATITGNYVGNYANGTEVPAYFIFLGRVTASRISQNVYTGAQKEPFVLFGYVHDPLNRPGVPEYLDDSTIENNSIHAVKDNYQFVNFPTNGTQTKNILAINQLSFAADSKAH